MAFESLTDERIEQLLRMPKRVTNPTARNVALATLTLYNSPRGRRVLAARKLSIHIHSVYHTHYRMRLV